MLGDLVEAPRVPHRDWAGVLGDLVEAPRQKVVEETGEGDEGEGGPVEGQGDDLEKGKGKRVDPKKDPEGESGDGGRRS